MLSINSPTENQLISQLPKKNRLSLLSHCETVDLMFGTTLSEPKQPFRHVYFPLSSFISLLVSAKDHPPLETGLIGNEGMLGATLLLGVNTSPIRSIVQGSGEALRMTAIRLRRELRENPPLLRILGQYLYISMVQQSQSVTCTHYHTIESRLARWLLMTHDRAHAKQFHLTHQFLAYMLGVRRSGITVAAGVLQKKKLIQYNRGDIIILNRKGLEAISCNCYRTMLNAYTSVLG